MRKDSGAMLSIAIIAIASLLALVFYKATRLVYFLSAARQCGLPYVVSPLLETEKLSLLLTPILRRVYHKHLLKDDGWPKWYRFIIKDWSWEDKRRAHDEYGDVFLVVSPEGIICYSADAALNRDVLNRRHEFLKPRDKYKILEPYGPNVTTAEGSTYRFHVRITAPPFGDHSGANDLVWSETMTQTRQMLGGIRDQERTDVQSQINALTLSVISLAGFGRQTDPFSPNQTTKASLHRGHRLSFSQALHETVRHIVFILLLPRWLLYCSPLRIAGLAHSELERYMRSMIRRNLQEDTENNEGMRGPAHGNLLNSVLQHSAMEAAAAEKIVSQKKKQAFTEEEVMGNLFVYLLAGYETTANAIFYGLAVLALRPDLQSLVREEVLRVWREAAAEGRSTLNYAQDFEKLTYTYRYMYETLRLFPGVTLITKMVHEPTSIQVAQKTIVLPAQTRVYLSSPATHYSEKYWPDPTKLDPGRWTDIDRSGTDEECYGRTEKRVVAADRTRHMRGTFLTFSDGSRACLGRKFAQAEYIAFFTQLLKEHNVELAQGTTAAEVEKDVYLRSAGQVTLSPPSGIKLAFRKR